MTLPIVIVIGLVFLWTIRYLNAQIDWFLGDEDQYKDNDL